MFPRTNKSPHFRSMSTNQMRTSMSDNRCNNNSRLACVLIQQQEIGDSFKTYVLLGSHYEIYKI